MNAPLTAVRSITIRLVVFLVMAVLVLGIIGPTVKRILGADALPKAMDELLYLPAIFTPPVPPPAKLSVDFGSLIALPEVAEQALPVAAAMGAQWSRTELPWLRIETSPGVYDWEAYDRAITRTVQSGMKVLALIHSSPAWAAVEGCGPISDTVALTNFLTTTITRYGDVVDAWEFMNEPDGLAPRPAYGPTIGCWAPYPAQYAQQLQLFYTTVKTLDPTALVMFGSLAYDSWPYFDREFLANALAAGAGPYFDVIGVHFYPIHPEDFPTMAHKIREIRAILDKQRVWNKHIWVTETSMWTNAGASLEDQRTYIVREQTRGLCSGADNLFWFAVHQEGANPPLHRWLINLAHQADQGYSTYQYYAGQVTGMTCQGRMANLPADIEAYTFDGSGKKRLHILWSNAAPTVVALPAATTAIVRNREGGDPQTISAQNGQVSVAVGTTPIYVVID